MSVPLVVTTVTITLIVPILMGTSLAHVSQVTVEME